MSGFWRPAWPKTSMTPSELTAPLTICWMAALSSVSVLPAPPHGVFLDVPLHRLEVADLVAQPAGLFQVQRHPGCFVQRSHRFEVALLGLLGVARVETADMVHPSSEGGEAIRGLCAEVGGVVIAVEEVANDLELLS